MSDLSQEIVNAWQKLLNREQQGHKGSYGRVLILGGSQGMGGAIALSGQAALRGGAGLVFLVVPSCVQSTVAAIEPSYLTIGLSCDEQGRITGSAKSELETQMQSATVAAIGPGLGSSPELAELVSWAYREWPIPLVCDADALNLLAKSSAGFAAPGGPRWLTPHPGEFARMIGKSTQEIQGNREAAVQTFFRQFENLSHPLVLTFKGAGTLVCDGNRCEKNSTGNPGMGTGGTGDVLTGLLSALIAQGLEPFVAARLAVHLHGLAGDLAAKELGQVSLIASDLIRFLPKAFLTPAN